MRHRLSLTSLALLLALGLLAAVSSASAESERVERVLDLSNQEGWTELQPGVWQRPSEEGDSLIRANGSEGIAFGLDLLRAQQTTLVESFLGNPTEANFQSLQHHSSFIQKLEEGLFEGRNTPGEPGAKALAIAPISPQPNCNDSISLSAFASHSLLCGAFTSANASYTNVLGFDICNPPCTVYTYSSWQRSCGSNTLSESTSCTDSGHYNVSCSSFKSSPTQYDSVSVYSFAYFYCPYYKSGPTLFLSESASESFTNQYGYCDC